MTSAFNALAPELFKFNRGKKFSAATDCLDKFIAIHADGTAIKNKWVSLDIEQPCAAVLAVWSQQDLFGHVYLLL